jgi:hypothetical protein
MLTPSMFPPFMFSPFVLPPCMFAPLLAFVPAPIVVSECWRNRAKRRHGAEYSER